MNVKAILAVVIVIGIGFLLLQTDSGRQYFGSGLDFFRTRVGNFVAGAFTYGGIFGQKMPEGLTFQISLAAPRQAFFGQNYTVTNASLSVSGVCTSAVTIGGTSLHKESAECSIELASADGLLEYTADGNVRFTGSAAVVKVDGTDYTASDSSRLQVGFEAAPLTFTLDRMAQPLLTLPAATGTIKRLATDGTAKSSETLDGERLEIAGFVGFLKLENSNILLQGSAVAAKGTGDHSSFVW